MRYYILRLYALVSLLGITACNGGLEPNNSHIPENKTYLTGTIRYKGGVANWNYAKDSVAFIRVVGFKTYSLLM